MKTLRALTYLVLSDFRERTRTIHFLMLLAAVAYLGFLVNNGDLLLHLDDYRGEFNSAWIGSMMVLVVNTFLSLFGFYLVKDTIERDRRTGVGQIIATTPIRRAVYLVGKWLSSFSVLLVLVALLAAAGVVMQFLKGQIASFDLAAMLLPFVIVALPMMALVAAVAVVFETIPWLKGSLGNIVYFFLWSFLIVAFVEGGMSNEPIGFNVFIPSMTDAVKAAYPGYSGGFGLTVGYPATLESFPWDGVRWTWSHFFNQWMWLLIGLGMVLVSSVFFSRFDPSREGLARYRDKQGRKPGRFAQAARRVVPNLSPALSWLARTSPFAGVTVAELRMLLKGQQWWWWIVLAGVNIAALSSPPELMQKGYLPFLWIWPMMIWSGMGSREKQHNTYQMVFSAARPVQRQLPAAWLAGVLATALFGLGPLIVFSTTGDLPALVSWVAAVIFIPSLALALGIFSGGSRLFEIVYLLWWYIGPINGMAALNYIAGRPLAYALLAVALLAVAVTIRARQIQSA